MAAPSLRCGPPRPTQSSGNAPSSPVEDDEQGCTQAVLGEGFSKVNVGNPSQKRRKRCMFRHMSVKTASGSGSEMGLLLAAWRRRGGSWRWLRPPCPRLFPALMLHLEVLWVPPLPLPGRGVDQETPEGGRGLWGGTDSATPVRVGLTWTNCRQSCRPLETGLTDGLSREKGGGVIKGHLET